ncbi:MAG: hypothetical protein PHF20_01465 [Halothiobacillaceae bacterium]|nr:hypothetical protein [Halothiobacillaceae bacterium]
MKVAPKTSIDKNTLAALFELYKPAKDDLLLQKALEAHFLEGSSLQKAGQLCGKTKQGMDYHVSRLRDLHASFELALSHLKKR